MIPKPAQILLGSPVKRARLLAALLLAAISWGSTAEFDHHHGTKARPGESIFAEQSSNADQDTSVQFEPGNTNGTSSKSKTRSECLICQLHQNLSATVVVHTPGVGPTETHGLNTPTTVVFVRSEFRSIGQGRAPPSYI